MRWKNTRVLFVRTLSLLMLTAVLPGRVAQALPTGEDVVSGSATFDRSDSNTLNITASQNSIIEYHSFNVGLNERLNFILPSTDSFVLNRVVGSQSSEILGAVTANGNVVLVNSNGIYFGTGAQVNVGGLMASTHDIANADFLRGRYIFAGTGAAATASILNEGVILTRDKGMAVLISDAIENKGVVEAPLGTVSFAAGKVVTVGVSGDGFVSIGLDEATAQSVLDKNGRPINDQIKNSGAVSANGGKVLLTAKSVGQIFQSAINLQGKVKADSVVIGQDGVVEITAAGGPIVVTGPTTTSGNTTFKADGNIVVNANVTTESGNLAFLADADLDGRGAFLQKEGTTIKTITWGDITIQSSGESTLANISSAGDLFLYKGGAPVTYAQVPGSTITTAASFNIGQGVTLDSRLSAIKPADPSSGGRGNDLLIGKDWINHGLFIPGASTVRLTGPLESVIKGNNTFNNLTVIEPEKNVTFEADKTQTILGVLTLNGGFGKLLNVSSTNPIAPWKASVLGTYDIQYVNLQNSELVYNHGPPAPLLHSKNSGNNTGFDFSPVIWIPSVIASPEGAKQSNLWSNPLNWDGGFIPGQFDSVSLRGAAGDEAISKIASASPRNDSIIDPAFQGAIAGLTLESSYTGTLILGRDLTVSGNWVHRGGTFDPGTSTVTFTDASRPSYILGDNTFYNFVSTTPDKEIYFEAGKTTKVTGTITVIGGYDTPAGEQLIKLRSTTRGERFILDVSPDHAAINLVNVSDAYTVESLFVHTGVDGGNNVNWDIDPTWDGGGSGNNWSTAANWVGDAVPTTTQAVTFDGTSTKDCTIDSLGSWSGGTFTIAAGYTGTITQNVAITMGAYSQAAGTYSGGSTATTFNSTFDLTGGTFTATSGTWTQVGNLTISGGTFNNNSGNLSIETGDANRTMNTGTATFNNVTINQVTSNARIITITGTMDIDGNLTITSLADGLVGGTITVAGNITTTDSSVSSSGAPQMSTNIKLDGTGSQTVGASGGTGVLPVLTINKSSGTTTIQDSIIAVGGFTHTAGTVVTTGSTVTLGDSTLAGHYTADVTGGIGFNNVTVNISNIRTLTISGGTLDVNGNLTISSVSVMTGPITVAGNLSSTVGGVSGTATITLDGTGSQTITVNSGATNYDLPDGTFTINKASGTASLAGNATTAFNATNQDLTITSGTLSLAGFNLTVNRTLTVGASGTLQLQGAETITATTKTLNSGSTVKFTGNGDGLANTYTPTSYFSASYQNLTINSTDGATDIFKLGAALSVAGAFTNTAGTFDVDSTNNYAMTVTGNWSNSGTFQARNGTVTLNGTSQTISGSTTFYNLTKTVTSADTLTFTAGTTQTIASGGTLKLRGASGQLLTLASSTTSAFTLTFADTTSKYVVDYVSVSYSTASGLGILALNSTDGGNNTLWTFQTTSGTLRYWIATGAGNWNDTANWSTTSGGSGGSSVPVSTSDAIFDGSANGNCTVNAAVDVKGLYLDGYSGTFSQGANTITVGADNYSQGTGTFTGGSSAITLNGTYTLSGGTFTATSGTITDNAKNWTYIAGTFNTNSGTVKFQPILTITGSHTLNNVTIDSNNTIATTLTIASGTTLTVAGTLTFDNSSTGAIVINTGTIAAQGNVTVADSVNYGAGSGSNSSATLLINGTGTQTFSDSATQTAGNLPDVNINKASGTLTLSGTLRTSSDWTWTAGTIDAGTSTVVFSGEGGTTHTITGSHTLNNVTIDSNASIATTLTIASTIASGTTLTVSGTLTLDNSSTGTISINTGTIAAQGNVTVADTNTYNGSFILNFTGSANQTFTSNTGFAPTGSPVTINKSAGTVTLAANASFNATNQDLTITSGTLSLAGFNLTVNRTLTVGVSGTLQLQGAETITATTKTLNSGSTVKFTGNGDGLANTYTPTSYFSASYQNLTIASTDGTTDTFQNGAALTVAGALTITAGTFNANTNTTTVTGLTTVSDSTYTGSTAAQTFTGGLSMTGATLSTTGAGSVVLGGNVTGNASATTSTISGALNLNGATRTFTIADGAAANDMSISAIISNGGLTKAGAGTLVLSGANTYASATTISAGTLNANATAALGDGSATNTLIFTGGTLQAAGTITSPSTRTVTLTSTGLIDTNGQSISIAGIASGAGGITKSGTGTLTLTGVNTYTGATTISAGVVNIQNANGLGTTAGGVTVSSGAELDLQGGIAVGAEALTLNGSGISSGGALRNVSGNNSWSGAITLGSASTIASDANTLTLTGAIDNGGFDLTFTGSGNTVFSGAVSGAGGLTKSGAGTLQRSTNSLSLAGALTISAGTFDANGLAITISGNWAQTGGTFTPGSNTVTFDKTSGTQTLNSGGTSFNNISHSGAGTLQLTTNALNTAGTFTNSAGTFDANALAHTVTGLATVSGGSYTAGSATQTFNGGLTVSGGTYTGGSGTTDVNGAVTLSSGTLTAPSGNLTVSGNFSHSGGTFTHNSGTVILDGTDQTISGSTTFNNLTKNVSVARTLTFAAGTTQTIAGTMDLEGAVDNLLSLRSSVSDTQWNIDPQGTRTIGYLDVKDSNNTNATAITAGGFNITNSGNNTNWNFPSTGGGGPGPLPPNFPQTMNSFFAFVYAPMGEGAMMMAVPLAAPIPAMNPLAARPNFQNASSFTILPLPFDQSVFENTQVSINIPRAVSFENAQGAVIMPQAISSTISFEDTQGSMIMPQAVSFEGGAATTVAPSAISFENTRGSMNMPQVVSFGGASGYARLSDVTEASYFSGVRGLGRMPLAMPKDSFAAAKMSVSLGVKGGPAKFEEVGIETRMPLVFPGGGNITPTYDMGIPLGAEKPLMEPAIKAKSEKSSSRDRRVMRSSSEAVDD